MKTSHSFASLRAIVANLYRFLLLRASPFWVQLCYFISFSLLGFSLLKVLPFRDGTSRVSHIDLFFMSVSAVTVSSMATVEMERFSHSQLASLTLLMLIGGEVFTSMLGIHFSKLRYERKNAPISNIEAGAGSELESATPSVVSPALPMDSRLASLRCLFVVVLGYFVVVHLSGFAFISIYLDLVPNARAVLEGKGIHALMFSVFVTVSSFANCGFVPVNENMIAFQSFSGLLIIVITQVLMGNTMYPSCLRLVIWGLKKMTKRREYEYILRNRREMGYDHLVSAINGVCLVLTVVGFVVLQLILFCCLEWESAGLSGLRPYQKIVTALFLSVNSRHAGESTVDLSNCGPAILVLFLVMMYLPPTTCFLIRTEDEESTSIENGKLNKRRELNLAQQLMLPNISCLAFFTILISITERRQLREDPLNFNILNIVVEVVSAFGNVGFTTGYSCKRQLNPNKHCKDEWVGFSGKWSSKGKLILIVVMFFGRLKKFNMGSAKAWKLS